MGVWASLHDLASSNHSHPSTHNTIYYLLFCYSFSKVKEIGDLTPMPTTAANHRIYIDKKPDQCPIQYFYINQIIASSMKDQERDVDPKIEKDLKLFSYNRKML